MRIILEGPDGSGKSTLAQLIARAFHIDQQVLFLIPSEGPEKYAGEILNRLRKYEQNEMDYPGHYLYDRHPAISHPIYSNAGGKYDTQLTTDEIDKLRDSVFIYCRSTNNAFLSNHREKSHDTAEHVEMIKEKHAYICDAYDFWALEHADLIYRMKDTDPNTVINYIKCRL